MTWPMISRLTEPDRTALLAAAVVRRFRNREVIFRAGDAGDTMFVIREGHVAVRIVTEYGDESTLVVLGPSDTFGELALLGESRTRGATVTAISDTSAWMLSRSQLATLRTNRPDIDQMLIDLLARQVAHLTGELLEARYVPVRHRVARVLDRLHGQYDGAVATQAPIELIITQDDVAGLVGAARPTVNKVLRNLETAGAIELRRGRIRVVDVSVLHRHRG